MPLLLNSRPMEMNVSLAHCGSALGIATTLSYSLVLYNTGISATSTTPDHPTRSLHPSIPPLLTSNLTIGE